VQAGNADHATILESNDFVVLRFRPLDQPALGRLEYLDDRRALWLNDYLLGD